MQGFRTMLEGGMVLASGSEVQANRQAARVVASAAFAAKHKNPQLRIVIKRRKDP